METLIFTLSFMLTPPGACIAWDPLNHGSYDSHRRSRKDCNEVVILHLTGTHGYAWKSETFFVADGWIRLWNEYGETEDGTPTNQRTFESSQGYPGLQWMPLLWSKKGSECNPEGLGCMYGSESLYGASCETITPLVTLTGWSPEVRMRYLGILPRWLQDRRASSQDQLMWHPVEAIQKEDTYDGGETVEKYTYGRWENPQTHTWESLGLIAFSVRGKGTNYLTREYHYLMDGKPLPACDNICPTGKRSR